MLQVPCGSLGLPMALNSMALEKANMHSSYDTTVYSQLRESAPEGHKEDWECVPQSGPNREPKETQAEPSPPGLDLWLLTLSLIHPFPWESISLLSLLRVRSLIPASELCQGETKQVNS